MRDEFTSFCILVKKKDAQTQGKPLLCISMSMSGMCQKEIVQDTAEGLLQVDDSLIAFGKIVLKKKSKYGIGGMGIRK